MAAVLSVIDLDEAAAKTIRPPAASCRPVSSPAFVQDIAAMNAAIISILFIVLLLFVYYSRPSGLPCGNAGNDFYGQVPVVRIDPDT